MISTIALWMPGNALKKHDFGYTVPDFIAHFSVFFILTFLLTGIFHLKDKGPINWNQLFISALFISMGYNIITEIVQIFIPGRSFEYKDLVVNFLGSIIGFMAYKFKIKLNTR